MRCSLFSGKIEILGPAWRAFHFGPDSELSVRRVALRSTCCWPLFGTSACGFHRPPVARSRVAQNAAPGVRYRINDFLRDHDRVLMVERSRLREKFRRTYSGAYGGIASVQRDPKLDVLPQFTAQRSSVHSALCSFHKPWPKRGGLARPCRGSARGLTAMQPVEQRDEVEMLSLMLLIRRFEQR